MMTTQHNSMHTEKHVRPTFTTVDSLTEISSCHIPLASANALGRDPITHHLSALYGLLTYTPWADHGWIIFCSADGASSVMEEHPELARLMACCVERDIAWLKIDEAGPVLQGLARFDW